MGDQQDARELFSDLLHGFSQQDVDLLLESVWGGQESWETAAAHNWDASTSQPLEGARAKQYEAIVESIRKLKSENFSDLETRNKQIWASAQQSLISSRNQGGKEEIPLHPQLPNAQSGFVQNMNIYAIITASLIVTITPSCAINELDLVILEAFLSLAR